MSLKFNCSKCNNTIIVKYLKVGETAKCLNCGQENIIPESTVETNETPAIDKEINIIQPRDEVDLNLGRITAWKISLLVFVLGAILTISSYLGNGFITFWFFLLLTVSISPTIILIAFFLRYANRVRNGWRRILSMIILWSSVPLQFIFFIILAIFLISGYQSGMHHCLICNKWVHRTEYFGLALSQFDKNIPKFYHSHYETWYWKNVGLEHEHDWDDKKHYLSIISIGSIDLGPDDLWGGRFYNAMVQIPDHDIAVYMVRKIATATHQERRRLLEVFKTKYLTSEEDIEDSMAEIICTMCPNEPWDSLIHEELSREDFIKDYQLWLEEHPEWK